MEVGLTPEAIEQFAALPRSIQPHVNEVILRLVKWPAVSGSKPLRTSLVGNFRIRTGDYRIVFRVTGDKLTSGRSETERMFTLTNRLTKQELT